jgi:hypothetical protein
VSVDALRLAGIPTSGLPVRRVEVRGKTQQLDVVALENPALLPLPGAA